MRCSQHFAEAHKSGNDKLPLIVPVSGHQAASSSCLHAHLWEREGKKEVTQGSGILYGFQALLGKPSAATITRWSRVHYATLGCGSGADGAVAAGRAVRSEAPVTRDSRASVRASSAICTVREAHECSHIQCTLRAAASLRHGHQYSFVDHAPQLLKGWTPRLSRSFPPKLSPHLQGVEARGLLPVWFWAAAHSRGAPGKW